MEALKSIPKALDQLDRLKKGSSIQAQFKQYKKSVKKFISDIEAEVCQLIDKYQTKIKQLREENNRIIGDKSNLTRKNMQTPEKTATSKSQEKWKIKGQSKVTKNLDFMPTAKSNVFPPFASQNNFEEQLKFSSILAKYKYKKDDDNNFPVQLINHQPADDIEKSRFEVKNKRKKQREEQLCHFLQTGKKNLNSTTQRFMESVGKIKKEQFQEEPEQLIKNDSETSGSFKKIDSGVNKSLGDICQNLDSSFVSKKARSQKRKKQSDIDDQIRKKQMRQEEIAKMIKSKGIKNLLQRLRENVDASPTKGPEAIKSSKLINSGSSPNKKSSKSIDSIQKDRRGSKVMINPVPVDIERKSQVTKKLMVQQPLSPQRKPQSILKKNNSNVLTRSLSGISVIEFAQ